MLAFYDKKPSVLEAVGDGSFKYRFDIKEKSAQEEESRTQWQCQEVTEQSNKFICNQTMLFT